MYAGTFDAAGDAPLRRQAESRLVDGIAPPNSRGAPGAEALGVLHALASTPASAGDALKLLHELQVHQVELDLQHEEMERTRIELTSALDRYAVFLDIAPVGYVAIDIDDKIVDGNRAAAELIGVARDELQGMRIDRCFSVDSRSAVSALTARVRASGGRDSCEVRRGDSHGVARSVRMVACASPRGASLVMALMDASSHPA